MRIGKKKIIISFLSVHAHVFSFRRGHFCNQRAFTGYTPSGNMVYRLSFSYISKRMNSNGMGTHQGFLFVINIVQNTIIDSYTELLGILVK